MIKAYYSAWCFPPRADGQPNTASVSIEHDDGSWEKIFSMDIRDDEGISKRSKRILARVILEHFNGGPVSDSMVEDLLQKPGISLCRLEPKELKLIKPLAVDSNLAAARAPEERPSTLTKDMEPDRDYP